MPKATWCVSCEFCLNLESVLTGTCQDEIDLGQGRGSLDRPWGSSVLEGSPAASLKFCYTLGSLHCLGIRAAWVVVSQHPATMHAPIRSCTSSLKGGPFHKRAKLMHRMVEVFAQSPSANKGTTRLLNLDSTMLSSPFSAQRRLARDLLVVQ